MNLARRAPDTSLLDRTGESPDEGDVPDLASLAIAFLAGAIAGTMNALAGGGTFVSMPALVALGLPSTIANATSNVALQPGAIASAWAYRRGLAPLAGIS